MESIIKPFWNNKPLKIAGYNLLNKTNLQVSNTDGDIPDFSELQDSIEDLPLPYNLTIQNEAATEGEFSVSSEDTSGVGSGLAIDKMGAKGKIAVAYVSPKTKKS